MAIENQKIKTYSQEQTCKFAAELAKGAQQGDVILLYGDLGMGKTVFCRSFIKELCGDNVEVPSPTFTIVQLYDYDGGCIWHFDLYRLSDPSEVYELGWEEALSEGIILVEWSERLGDMIPKGAIKVSLSVHNNDPNSREIKVVRQ